MVRAVLEGIASQVVELARLVERDFGAPLTRLRADGGLTKSASLMQAVADLLQLPVDIYPSAHATAVGAAAFARLALHADLAPAEAVGGWIPSRTYEPRWSPDRAAEHHARWLAAAEAAMPVEQKR
jgi:glycerol kinase